MADSDKTLKLLIELGVIGKEDAQALNDLLGESKNAAQGLNQSMPEGWEAMGKYKAAMGGTGDSAEGLHGHLNGLRQLMRGAGPEAAELGHLLHFAFNPAMLAGAVAAGGFEVYFKWLEKSQEKQKEMTADLQKHNDYLREMIKLKGNVNELEIEHAKSLAAARVEAEGLTKQIEHAEEVCKMFAEADKLTMASREAASKRENSLIENRIGLIEDLGKITKAEAEQSKLIVEHQEKLAAIQNDISQKRTAAVSAENALKDYVAALAGNGYKPSGNMAGGFSLSPEAIASGDDQSRILKKQAEYYEDAKKTGETELKRLETLRDQTEAHKKAHGSEYDGATGKLWSSVDEQQIKDLNQQIAQQKGLIADASENLLSIEQAAAEAADTAKILHEANKTLGRLFSELNAATNAFKDAQTQGAAGKNAEQQNFGIAATDARLKGGATPAGIFANAINAMAILDHMQEKTGFGPEYYSRRGTPQQKSYIQHLQDQVMALSQLESAVGNNGHSVIGAINEVVKTAGENSQELNRVTIKWMTSLNNQFSTMKKQIESLSTFNKQ